MRLIPLLSPRTTPGLLVALALVLTLTVSTDAVTSPPGSTVFRPELAGGVIVKLRSAAGATESLRLTPDKLRAFRDRAGVDLRYHRRMSTSADVLRTRGRIPLAKARAIAAAIAEDPDVLYAEPDRIMRAMAVPDDPLYVDQWHYHDPGDAGDYGANLPGAWDITQGAASVVVAVIDTGSLPHAELAGHYLAGYDFISEDSVGVYNTANDGDGRDPDPSDPGDWITAAENASGFFSGCAQDPVNGDDSSWHGTHVAGTIGAESDNGSGVAGIIWNSTILPVRVLGKCGGYFSDIIDGMRWAAGLTVAGVPANTTPAKVLNLSLGGSGTCSTPEQDAIDEIVAAGAVVVVAAGNESRDARDASPGNCDGVITVAATGRFGSIASYSNFGGGD